MKKKIFTCLIALVAILTIFSPQKALAAESDYNQNLTATIASNYLSAITPYAADNYIQLQFQSNPAASGYLVNLNLNTSVAGNGVVPGIFTFGTSIYDNQATYWTFTQGAIYNSNMVGSMVAHINAQGTSFDRKWALASGTARIKVKSDGKYYVKITAKNTNRKSISMTIGDDIVLTGETIQVNMQSVDATLIDNTSSSHDDKCFQLKALNTTYDARVALKATSIDDFVEKGEWGDTEIFYPYTFVVINGEKVFLNSGEASIKKEEIGERNHYVLDANLVGGDGKVYHIVMRYPSANDLNYDNAKDNFNTNFNSCTVNTESGTGHYTLNAESGTGNNHKSIHIEFYTDVNKAGKIPTGLYTIGNTDAPGTVHASYGADSYGMMDYSFASTTNYSKIWYLRSGTINVINTNENYYVEVNATNSKGKTIKSTIGTKPKFTVTITKDPSDYGTVSQASVANVPYGTVITTSNNTVTINGTTITATPATATAQYTYAFTGWTNGTATVTEATTVTANFSRTTNKYAVTINTPEHGTLTVKNGETPIASGTEVDYGTTLTVTYEADDHYHFDAWTNDGAESVTVNAAKTIGATFAINTNTLTWDLDGGTITTAGTEAGQVAYGTTLTAPEVEKAGYTFAGWDPEVDETMPDNDVTYTAQWEEASTFTLEDQHNAGETYYATLADFVGDAKDVTYARTFQGGSAETPYWNVFSLPFDYMLAGSSHPFAGKVLDLSSASYDAVNDEVTLNFLYETYQIEANKPYALINKGSEIANPIFENVTFVTLSENTYSVPCTTGGEVTFVNTTYRQQMEANKRNILFIGNNQLLYPGEDAYLRAFRGYFLLENVLPQNAAPKRVRLMIEGESVATGLSTEFAPEVQSAKRIEDGVLIIERNGNRYDAQGKELK